MSGHRSYEWAFGCEGDAVLHSDTRALERLLAALAPPGTPASDWVQTWADEGFRIETALAWASAGVRDAGRARALARAGLDPVDMARRCVCRSGLVRDLGDNT